MKHVVIALFVVLAILVLSFADAKLSKEARQVEEVHNVLAALAQSGSTFSAHTEGWGTFKIHGKYCGPGYCGGKYGDYTKTKCNTNVAAVDCADQCCKSHDSCCVNHRSNCGARGANCDAGIVSCIQRCLDNKKCKWYDAKCLATKAIWKGVQLGIKVKPNSKCC